MGSPRPAGQGRRPARAPLLLLLCAVLSPVLAQSTTGDNSASVSTDASAGTVTTGVATDAATTTPATATTSISSDSIDSSTSSPSTSSTSTSISASDSITTTGTGSGTTSSAGSTASSSPSERVWAAVAFVLPGDSTPLAQGGGPSLTPLGAQQLHDQGGVFRSRYLTNASASGSATHLVGLDPDYIDNARLVVAAAAAVAATSNDTHHTTAGALAFLQGLYPPVGSGNGNGSDSGSGSSSLANGSVIDSPLGGYQYPNVVASSSSDENFIWLDGRATCDAYAQLQQSLVKDSSTLKTYKSTLDFYTSLWEPLFRPVFTRAQTSFDNAYLLWDYAEYRWTHDNATRELMTQADLDQLRSLAAEQQWYANADLASSVSASSDSVRTVAGRTLAGRTVQVLEDSISQGGAGTTLDLTFVPSVAPLVGFFALAGLAADTGASTALPGPGAAAVFELFSTTTTTAGNAYPSQADLRVRFLYRNDTVADSLQAYPLFGGSSSGSGSAAAGMGWADFAATMRQASVVANASAWCQQCGFPGGGGRSEEDGFCAQYFAGALLATGGRHKEGPMSAVVGGFIGAASTLVVLAVTAILVSLYRGVGVPGSDGGESAAGSKKGRVRRLWRIGKKAGGGGDAVVVPAAATESRRLGEDAKKEPVSLVSPVPAMAKGVAAKEAWLRTRAKLNSRSDISVHGLPTIHSREDLGQAAKQAGSGGSSKSAEDLKLASSPNQ